MIYYLIMSNKKKIGLALSSGGWRGLAHIGVLKVLEENNIPIDFIAGTSAGALVGGLYSYFGNSKDLEEFVLKFGYKDLFKIVADPKLKSGLIKGDRLIRYLNKLTDNANIEDLRIPFRAVSTDLLTGKTYYFKKGNLAEAIKSSISIPLVFRPTKQDSMYLVDGGVTENVPVKCVKDMGADFVIVSSVNTTIFPVEMEDVSSSRKIAEISARAVLGTLSEMMSSQADFVIKPKIPKSKVGIGVNYFLEFVKEKELVKIGQKETEDRMRSLKYKIKA